MSQKFDREHDKKNSKYALAENYLDVAQYFKAGPIIAEIEELEDKMGNSTIDAKILAVRASLG